MASESCPTVFVPRPGAVSNALWGTLVHPLEGLGPNAGANGWGDRQVAATKDPRSGFERSLRVTLLGLAEYADAHERQYSSKIGADGVLGREWLDALRGVRGLFNGELGRFDGGTLDKAVHAMAEAAGLKIDG